MESLCYGFDAEGSASRVQIEPLHIGHGYGKVLPFSLDDEQDGEGGVNCAHGSGFRTVRRVAFQGVDVGRRFLCCPCEGQDMCDFVYWLDDEWPEHMQRALQRLWARLEAKIEEEHREISLLLNEEKRKRKEAEEKKKKVEEEKMMYIEKNKKINLAFAAFAGGVLVSVFLYRI